MKLRQRTEAIADFSEAIRLDPKYAGAYHDRGCVYVAESMGQGVADLSRAIELSSAHG